MKVYTITDKRGLEWSTEETLFAAHEDDGQAFWVDVNQTDVGKLGKLFTWLNLHPLVLDNCLDPAAGPPIAPYTKCLFIRIPVQRHWDDTEHTYVAIVCTSQVLVTVQGGEVPALNALAAAFTEGMKLRAGTVTAMLYQIMDLLVDDGMAFALASRRRLEKIQSGLPDDSDPIFEVSRLKQTVGHLEDNLEDLRLSFSNLQTVQTDFFDVTDLQMYYRDTLAHLDSALSSIDRQQTRLAELHHWHLLMLQDKTNRRLRILTVLSAVFMPLTLIAGIYGMNFPHMPELQWPGAYPAVLAGMVLLAGLLLWNFFRRGWFD